ncbi:MAG TPA: aminotransferase class V-fold PLP-dependent enzyme [Candidatus Krumholzibacteria bacterium]|nr:aminotransferase class V-fold PLP-dependent enzyme [Candidatus Krumholzibacteria bacterium]HPD72250.1 aminotransferase class V-fold PLP-dependent enzyme [Candidatus Krumholzibacteria bacterium]HRY40818.1 aminotransferase class V-fold PLP-dependent enzyme [Candidatus Krumholzibacteria bacterium]
MSGDPALRDLFLLDHDWVFLNHGSFGACPKPVHDRYQELQRELERNPVAFLAEDREFPERMRAARQALADVLGARRDDLVFVPNATFGVNLVARSLPLGRGDEVLVTDHAYGAVDRTWQFVCERRGARLVRAPIDLPVTSAAQVVEAVWSNVTERTRVLCLDHLTSSTALVVPVGELAQRARREGILTVVDGAHAPGQIDLDVGDLGADVYVGNCHKWLLAPKGAGFLWARPDIQPQLEPLVVSWGWRSDRPGPSRFVDEHEWTGTRDPAACLAVPAALAFRAAHDWPRVGRRCHALLRDVRQEIGRLTGRSSICPDDDRWYAQMHALPLPPCDRARVQRELRERYRIEVPLTEWRSRPLLRVSIQGYNTRADADALVRAMAQLLKDDRFFGSAKGAVVP